MAYENKDICTTIWWITTDKNKNNFGFNLCVFLDKSILTGYLYIIHIFIIHIKTYKNILLHNYQKFAKTLIKMKN